MNFGTRMRNTVGYKQKKDKICSEKKIQKWFPTHKQYQKDVIKNKAGISAREMCGDISGRELY